METRRRVLGTRITRTARTVAVLTGALGLVILAPAAAGARTVSAAPAGSCVATPNPALVGSLYVVSGTGLGANRMVNVFVTDAKGTQWGSVMTGATGAATYSGVASVLGSYSVKITDTSRKLSPLAACAFSAR